MFSSDIILALASSSQDGIDGKSLEFDWQGTQLGIRVEGEVNYTYVDLQGLKGDKGDKGDAGTTDYNLLINKPDFTQGLMFGNYQISETFNRTLTKTTQQGSAEDFIVYLGRMQSGVMQFFITSIGSHGYDAGILTIGLNWNMNGTNNTDKHSGLRISLSNLFSFPELIELYSVKQSNTTADIYALYRLQSFQPVDSQQTLIWQSIGIFNEGIEGFYKPSITEKTSFNNHKIPTNIILNESKLSISSLPTSSTGLTTGDVWRDSNGFLRII